MTSPLVSVIICSYNSAKIIEPCLRSLIEQTHRNVEVIIVDAGSTDDTILVCKEEYPEATVLIDHDNRGYCYAENLGILQSKGEFVVMVNSDAWLDRQCIEEMTKTVSNDSSIAAVAPKIFLPLQNGRLDSVGTSFAKDFSGMNRGHMELDSQKYDSSCDVFGVSDAVALYRRSSLSTVGGYDARFLAYQEESDLCLRLRMAGFRIVFNPKAIGYHLSSATVGQFSRKKIMLSERNVWWTAIKNCPTSLIPSCAFHLALRYATFARLLFGGQQTRASHAKSSIGLAGMVKIFQEAVKSTIVNASYLLQQRSQIQSRFKPSAGKILETSEKYAYDLQDWFVKTSTN